ncbi:hypothetical protein K4Q31_12115 [Staphylococcus epidermidis]|nr:hypothetical protein [Staphylococcus epidermidis]MCG2085446.1 hypothetical protein [Staphylococcus epidermidis]MCG2254742.1 hypothetical protein [Staphylococcus epidermidis]HDE6879211.1 hypothetical protein [Staphylococcus aureus]
MKRKIRIIKSCLYKETKTLDTTSFFKFSLSLLKRVPLTYWIYAIVISIFFSVANKDLTIFKNFVAYPAYNSWIFDIYTFIVIVLLPFALAYIKFSKPFGFSGLYAKVVGIHEQSVSDYNENVKKNKDKVYSTDQYKFEPEGWGSWKVTNVSAKNRQKGRENYGCIMYLIYPILLFMFLMCYMYILYHIIILVAVLIILHMFYMYKRIKEGRYI